MKIIVPILLTTVLLSCNNDELKNMNSEVNKLNEQIDLEGYYEQDIPEGKLLGTRDSKGFRQGSWKRINKNGVLDNVSFFKNDSLLYNFDPSYFITELFVFGGDRYSIQRPVNWTEEDNPASVVTLINDVNSSTEFKPNIVISELQTDDLNLEVLLKNILDGLKSGYEEFESQSALNLQIDDRDAIYTLYSVKVNDEKLLGSLVLISDSERVISINMMGSLKDDGDIYLFKSVYEEVFTSFKFIN